MLVPLRPLRENKGDLIKTLDLLNPWGITPLLGAVDYASRESQLSKGGGAIVVITDGAPSDMGKNFRNKEAGFKAVAEDRAINLFIIGFNVDLAGEEKAKWESFRDLLATTPRVQKPVTNDPLKLTEEIERAIKPSQTVTVAMPSSDIGAVQTLLLNGPPVAITAGMYEVQYPNVVPWPVHIRGGEKIELKLRFDKGSTGEFERRPTEPIQSFSAIADPIPPERQWPTKLQSLSFRTPAGADAVLQVCLENDDVTKPVDRPEEIWFDVRFRDDPAHRLRHSHGDQWPINKFQRLNSAFRTGSRVNDHRLPAPGK